MNRIPLYLMALIIAIASTPLDIFDVHAWNMGTVKADPWRKKSAGVTAAVRGAFAGMLRFLGLHQRSLFAAAACLLCLCLLAPEHADAGATAAVVMVGQLSTNIDAMERDLLKKAGEAAALFEKTARECQAHEVKDAKGNVTEKGRLMTDDEKKAIQALIDEGTALKAQIARAKGDASFNDKLAELTAGMGAVPANLGARERGRILKSMGQQFVDAPEYDFFKKGGHRSSSTWRSPSVELHATTLETDVTSGGDLIVTDYRPGITPLTFKRLVVADLLASGTTNSSSISYMKETTFTNAADTVAEGAPKPESTLVFDLVNDLVRKIAHWLPVTEEMLEDVAQIRSYIDARLRLGVQLAEEDQLLNGSGTAPDIQGLLNRSGLTTAEVRAGSVTNAEAIFIEQMKIFNASFVMPTGTIMNPANWQTTQLSKDGDGRYYGAGPFAGPQAPTLWGLPVVVTPSIVANTALTGAFNSAAQVFRHGGIRVEASNSHADFFIRNLVAIRAEERLALAVYRPSAFGKITSLT